jgi:hypothetical protein
MNNNFIRGSEKVSDSFTIFPPLKIFNRGIIAKSME